MSEVGPADRSRLLRSKRNDLRYINSPHGLGRKRMARRIDACHFYCADGCSGIVTSRKRKLREFFAVCDNEGPVPQTTYSSPDAPPTTAAEERFLDVTDILKYVRPTSPTLSRTMGTEGWFINVALLTWYPETGSSTSPTSQRVDNYAPRRRDKEPPSARLAWTPIRTGRKPLK